MFVEECVVFSILHDICRIFIVPLFHFLKCRSSLYTSDWTPCNSYKKVKAVDHRNINYINITWNSCNIYCLSSWNNALPGREILSPLLPFSLILTVVDFFYLLKNVKLSVSISHITTQHTHKFQTTHIKLFLTIMRVPFPPSLVVSCKAEHRNSNEDGQDYIRGNNANYGRHVYYITRTTVCEGEKRL